MARAADNFFHGAFCSNRNCFTLAGEFAPFMADQITVGLQRMEFLPVDFDVVAKRRRDAPGDLAIVAQLNGRGAGNGRAPDFESV